MRLFLNREVQGAVSILLVVIMVPMMVLSALMVDTARYSLSKSMVASAGDLSMNAALADYDTILKDVYGLFAMSQVDEVEDNVKQYFEDTLVSYGVVGEEDAGAYVENLIGALYQSLVLDGAEIANFLSMTVDTDNVKVEKVEYSSLADPAILEKQIVEYMKYRGPVEFGMSFFDSLSAFTKVEEQTTVVQAQVKTQESMGEVAKANSQLYLDIVGGSQGGAHVEGYEEYYSKWQDNADEGFRLKEDYGNILLSYRQRYEAVHRMALIFCVTAYNGDSGVCSWEANDLQILNKSGDYIEQGDNDSYSVSSIRSTAMAGESYAEGLKTRVENLWPGDNTTRLNQLYGDKKFSDDFSRESGGYRCFVSEEGQETAIREFREVDLFYKKDYSKYKELLDRLDEYVAAAGNFDVAIGQEIKKQQQAKAEAEAARDKAEAEKSRASKDIEKIDQKLDDWKYDSYKEELADYEKNRDEMAHASEAEQQSLKEDKDRILGEIRGILEENGVSSMPEMEDLDSFVETVINEKDEKEKKQDEVEEWGEKFYVQLRNIDDLDSEIKRLQREREEVASRLRDVLAACEKPVNAYNADLKIYKNYKSKVRDWISGEVEQIAGQFNLIHSNLESLDAKLKEALDHHAAARAAISSYLGNVGTWNAENQKYAANTDGGSGDNFSMTNEEDIRSAENTFDLDEVDKLGEELQKRYDMVHNFLTAIDSNFQYMDKKCIGEITNAEQVREVVVSSVIGSEITAYGRPGVSIQASPENISRWFADYYRDDIDPEALKDLEKMTEPYPCCKFMNYLRQTFRQDSGADTETGENGGKSKEDYEKNIENIQNGSLSVQIKEQDESDKSGSMPWESEYQYNKEDCPSIGGPGYPSGNAGEWKSSVGQNKAASSDGLEASKSAGSNLLQGLGRAMETGRDKLLVMSYLFGNFSYNTIVQDMAREAHKDLSWPNSKAEYYYSNPASKQLWQARTSSGYAINKVNNPMYGAEIEYVLFGNRDPQANVDCMKGSIFAIRVLFNSIYAFTDSEIRNMARGVGMTVQAATLGVIPYQLVMVVVQLALAIGESAIDLKKMEVGEQVAIIKSSSTWMLSGTGMMNLVRDGVTQVASDTINEAGNALTNTINEIVDASGEELKEIAGGVGKNLEAYAESAVKETTDRIFARIESTVEVYVNEVAYFDDSELTGDETAAKTYMVSQVDSAFNSIKTDLHSWLDKKKREDSVEGKVCAAICGGGSETLDGILDGLAREIKDGISTAPELKDARASLYEQAYQIRETISGRLTGLTKEVIGSATGALQGAVDQTANAIKEKAGELVGESAEAAREAVVGELNTFMDGLASNGLSLDVGSDVSLARVNGVDTSSGNLATQIKFGYSDYLKLFVFIGLCADDSRNDAMIRRIGDLIQYNIANAKDGSALQHKKGEYFTMVGAKTYISIDAAVDLDMMFLNLGFFQRQVESYNEELEEDQRVDLDSTLQVRYIGIAGY